jgi:mono/diheme cytochrome c family protein
MTEPKMAFIVWRNVGIPLLTLLLIVAGCGKDDGKAPPPAAPPGAPGGPGAGTAPDGKVVFAASGCAKCHAVNEPGRRRKGPDLGKVGADPAHTAQWLTEYVKNPKTHKPDSKMPRFEGKIGEPELRSLGEYLAGLK